MNSKLYIGDIAPTTTENELHGLFSEHGNVIEVNLALDRQSRRPLGFGVVTMATSRGAQAAIQALNGKQFGTSVLTVSDVRPLANH